MINVDNFCQDKVPMGKQIRKRRRSSSSSSNTSTSSTCSDDMRNPKKNKNKAVKKATPMTGKMFIGIFHELHEQDLKYSRFGVA